MEILRVHIGAICAFLSDQNRQGPFPYGGNASPIAESYGDTATVRRCELPIISENQTSLEHYSTI